MQATRKIDLNLL